MKLYFTNKRTLVIKVKCVANMTASGKGFPEARDHQQIDPERHVRVRGLGLNAANESGFGPTFWFCRILTELQGFPRGIKRWISNGSGGWDMVLGASHPLVKQLCSDGFEEVDLAGMISNHAKIKRRTCFRIWQGGQS